MNGVRRPGRFTGMIVAVATLSVVSACLTGNRSCCALLGSPAYAADPPGGIRGRVGDLRLPAGVLQAESPDNTQADQGFGPLVVDITGWFKNALIAIVGGDNSQDVDRLFPEWRPVGQPPPGITTIRDHRGPTVVETKRLNIVPSYQIVEGVITPGTDCHVSSEDLSLSHYTHDFCFDVTPDPDYQSVLGRIVVGDDRKPVDPPHLQDAIECEWETGLGQDNDGNPASTPNKQGDSYGFYSEGHKHRDLLWQWPTVPDRVHVEGLWVWDRGHTPRTEIHPPRLVAVQRHLLAAVPTASFEASSPYCFGTRCDVFLSSDGSAYWNNRPGQPFYVHPVTLNDRDYTFTIHHAVPRPGGTDAVLSPLRAREVPGTRVERAQSGPALKYLVVKQALDDFPGEPIVGAAASGTLADPTPQAKGTIPWKSRGVSNTNLFARTIFLYWDKVETHGLPDGYTVRAFNVTLDK